MGSINGHIHNGDECHELCLKLNNIFPSYFSRVMLALGSGGVEVLL